MASIWNILGLDGPTSDRKAIRRAYAKTLRVTRPDEDPEGFMALRDAFERAKTHAFYYAGPDDDEGAPVPALPFAKDENDTEPGPPSSNSGPEEDPDPISTADYLPDDLEPAVPALPAIEIVTTAEQSLTAAASEPEEFSAYVFVDKAASLLNSGRRNSEPKWERLLSRAEDLSIDEYNIFEQKFLSLLLDYFGYFDPPEPAPSGLKKWLPKRRKKRKPKLDIDTGTFIFKSMGWNRWKSFPEHVQTELLYILYEIGIKDRPKPEEGFRQGLFSEARFIMKVFGITVIFGLLGMLTEPPEDTTPLPPPLPNSGEALYGDYSYSEAEEKWKYELSESHEAVKNLKTGEVLRDQFELQLSNDTITKFHITIWRGTEKMEITDWESTRPVRPGPPGGLHTVFFLISGLFGLFVMFRLFGFVIGVVFGLIGFFLGTVFAILRGIFRR